MMNNRIVELKEIVFSYGGGNILDHVEMEIAESDFLAVVGPNGSGKSTLMKICLGLLKPQKGSVSVFGEDIAKFRDWGKIGYIPQKATSFNQGFPATVREVVTANLYSSIGLGGRLRKEHRERVDKALETVGMQDFGSRLIGRLSGGQQQRVFIAKTLVSDPRIIFMDEPTVGIDSHSEESFYELMGDLNRKRNITMVIVTHDIGAVSKRVNRILCLSDGKILEHSCKTSHEYDIFNAAYTGHSVSPVVHDH